MKDDQIHKLFSKWQTRLKLDHWDVELEILNDGELPLGGDGEVDINLTYLTATIRLARNHYGGIPRSKKELSQAAIHEIIHIHLPRLRASIERPVVGVTSRNGKYRTLGDHRSV